jgi:hypothetical protein
MERNTTKEKKARKRIVKAVKLIDEARDLLDGHAAAMSAGIAAGHLATSLHWLIERTKEAK